MLKIQSDSPATLADDPAVTRERAHSHAWTPRRLKLLANTFDARVCICGAAEYMIGARWVSGPSALAVEESQPHGAEHDWLSNIADAEGRVS